MDDSQDVLLHTKGRMNKAVEALGRDLNSVRTGRASPLLIEDIQVDYYGSLTPLNQLASISVPEARVLMIQPWDKQASSDIEKAILKSDLSLVPNNDGSVIRINIPMLTTDRRKELVKLVSSKLEDGHVSVRNIRRESINTIRQMEKNKDLSKDESKHLQGQLQEITNTYITNMDHLATDKETEVMEV